MASCRSSRFFPVTRICLSCSVDWILSPEALRNLEISLALSPSRPCLKTKSWRAWPSGEISGSFCSTLRRSMLRLASLATAISRRPFRREASSAVRRRLPSFSISILASDPLKSKRVASSRRAWSTALRISWRSISETMSKVGMILLFDWGRQDSNLQPSDYEPPALTVELHPR